MQPGHCRITGFALVFRNISQGTFARENWTGACCVASQTVDTFIAIGHFHYKYVTRHWLRPSKNLRLTINKCSWSLRMELYKLNKDCYYGKLDGLSTSLKCPGKCSMLVSLFCGLSKITAAVAAKKQAKEHLIAKWCRKVDNLRPIYRLSTFGSVCQSVCKH